MTGSVLSPDDAYLILRGMKTLGIRMKKHVENAQKLAEYLKNNKHIIQVNYPGLEGDKNHAVASKQMYAPGAILSFITDLDFEKTKELVNNLKVFTLAVSLGDAETLIEHPASMTHSTYSKEALAESGISESLVRVSVGLEDVEDLIADFEQALAKVTK